MTTTMAATLSIQKEAGYSALRICAQTCVDRGNDNSDLEGHLECGDKQILNACFCRTDLRPTATTFLSSCIITRCKYNSQDVTSALKLYDGYCSFKPMTTSATTTKKSTVQTTSTKSSKTSSSATPAPSITAFSPTSSAGVSSRFSSSSTLSASTANTTPEGAVSPGTTQTMEPGTIAGIAIGAIAFVFFGIAVLMWFCRRSKKEVGDPYFGRVRQFVAGGAHKRGVGQHHGSDAAYVIGGEMYKGRARSSHGSRGVESFDIGTIAATPMDFTTTNNAYPLVKVPEPVEICDTGFRAELDAGRDGAGAGVAIYGGEKG